MKYIRTHDIWFLFYTHIYIFPIGIWLKTMVQETTGAHSSQSHSLRLWLSWWRDPMWYAQGARKSGSGKTEYGLTPTEHACQQPCKTSINIIDKQKTWQVKRADYAGRGEKWPRPSFREVLLQPPPGLGHKNLETLQGSGEDASRWALANDATRDAADTQCHETRHQGGAKGAWPEGDLDVPPQWTPSGHRS